MLLPDIRVLQNSKLRAEIEELRRQSDAALEAHIDTYADTARSVVGGLFPTVAAAVGEPGRHETATEDEQASWVRATASGLAMGSTARALGRADPSQQAIDNVAHALMGVMSTAVAADHYGEYLFRAGVFTGVNDGQGMDEIIAAMR